MRSPAECRDSANSGKMQKLLNQPTTRRGSNTGLPGRPTALYRRRTLEQQIFRKCSKNCQCLTTGKITRSQRISGIAFPKGIACERRCVSGSISEGTCCEHAHAVMITKYQNSYDYFVLNETSKNREDVATITYSINS